MLGLNICLSKVQRPLKVSVLRQPLRGPVDRRSAFRLADPIKNRQDVWFDHVHLHACMKKPSLEQTTRLDLISLPFVPSVGHSRLPANRRRHKNANQKKHGELNEPQQSQGTVKYPLNFRWNIRR